MSEVLPEGLYETPVTRALMLRLEATRQAGLSPTLEDFEKVEHNLLVARHVAAELLRGLESLPAADRERRQIELCNELLGRIGGHDQAALDDSRKVLLSVHRGASPPVRPSTPIALSGLLTGARDEPQFGNDLEAEIASADRIDALVSFVTWEGWRRLQDAFEAFARAGRRLRLLTTTYTGATDADAVEALAQLPGASVRVSYDTRARGSTPRPGSFTASPGSARPTLAPRTSRAPRSRVASSGRSRSVRPICPTCSTSSSGSSSRSSRRAIRPGTTPRHVRDALGESRRRLGTKLR